MNTTRREMIKGSDYSSTRAPNGCFCRSGAATFNSSWCDRPDFGTTVDVV